MCTVNVTGVTRSDFNSLCSVLRYHQNNLREQLLSQNNDLINLIVAYGLWCRMKQLNQAALKYPLPHFRRLGGDHYVVGLSNALLIEHRQCFEQALHDDVIQWKHFPRYWPFMRGIHRSPVNSPHKGQWRGALMFSLICVWINGWVNNHEAGDLRRYRAHYDVIVMEINDRLNTGL